MLKLTNPRGEIAMTDGARVWSGSDTDETSVSFNELQDIETIFPQFAVPEHDCRVCIIAKDCLFNRAPSITPNGEDEKEAFRCVWNICTELKGEMDVKVYEHIFSVELGVFAKDVFVALKCGHATVMSFTRDAFTGQMKDHNARPFSLFTTPSEPFGCSRAYNIAMQMAVLAAGAYVKSIPFGCPILLLADKNMTRCETDDRTANAALMIALRARTPWFKNFSAKLPF